MVATTAARKTVRGTSGAILARYIRFVRRTSRIHYDPADWRERLEAERPFIYAFWHGQFLLIPAFSPQTIPVDVMVARHGDAELIGQTLSHFGMGLIRGAGAGDRRRDRGGASALRGALKSLAEGRSLSMTADVPPGPARRAGEGIVTLARLSGRPIIPVAVASSRFKVLDTWSRMTINLPYSTIGVSVGKPIHVPREATAEALEAARLEVEAGLSAATKEAYRLADADPARIAVGDVRKTGSWLPAYRGLTRALTPVGPAILTWRTRRGKEDPLRRGERLGIASMPRPPGKLIWMHAASVGETNAVLPLVHGLANRHPSLTTLLTTGTVTSARLAAERLPARALHQFVPLDAPRYVERFLAHWKPDLAVFVESEIWPNLVLETERRGTPLVLANARMSKRSFQGWKRRRNMARTLFGAFDLVLAQNDTLARRFSRLGAPRVVAVGNLKIDAPPPPVDDIALQRLRVAIADRPLFLAASTHPGEEQEIAEAYRLSLARLPRLVAIIVPRHPERGPSIARRLAAEGFRVALRSEGELPGPAHQIYVADTLGELGTFYRLSPISFIGGSLIPHGGQNPIEATKLGSVCLTGPHWENFKDAFGALIKADGAREIASAEALSAAIWTLTQDADERRTMQRRAEAALGTLAGALNRTLELLDGYLADERRLDRAS
ncbi:MAG: glycosyltransferase N-terminal domain-containing protein [Hyphomicrobiaceae bacterium]